MDRSFTIREGYPSDDAALLELAGCTPMKGRISFRTDRFPSFYHLLERRGPSVLFVAESNGAVIGSVSTSAMNLYVDGKPTTCQYIGDFKVHPDFRKSGVGLALAKALAQRLQELGTVHVLSAVIAGNRAPDRFLAGSPDWPAAQHAGQFLVRQILPKPARSKSVGFEIRAAVLDESMLALLNTFMKQFRYGTVFPRPEAAQTLSAWKDGKLLALMVLADVEHLKQDVPTGLTYLLNAFVNLLRPLLKQSLPKQDEAVRALYIRAFACEMGQETALKALLEAARAVAFNEKYHVVTIGLHEKNPWKDVFVHNLGFSLRSNLYETATNPSSSSAGTPWLDYSLV